MNKAIATELIRIQELYLSGAFRTRIHQIHPPDDLNLSLTHINLPNLKYDTQSVNLVLELISFIQYNPYRLRQNSSPNRDPCLNVRKQCHFLFCYPCRPLPLRPRYLRALST
jgi:hypothetical protein